MGLSGAICDRTGPTQWSPPKGPSACPRWYFLDCKDRRCLARPARIFGKWSSVYRQFRRWTLSGLWELLLEAFNDSGGGSPSLQMIDSTIIRAHHCSAGAKGGLKKRVLGAQKVASRPRSISASMQWASLSRLR